jgi:hypothetical protein
MTRCRRACRDGEGNRLSRCPPILPDCTPAQAVVGSPRLSPTQPRRNRARPNGIALLGPATPTGAARAEQRDRLDFRMEPQSGLRFEYSWTLTRQVFFLKLLGFTVMALAVVPFGGVHACAHE